jgi:hypothetical protein
MMVQSLQLPLSRLGQRAESFAAYPSGMGLQQIKSTAVSAWVLAATLIGLIGGVTSPGGLIVLAALGLLPPLALLLFWNDPSQTMSERIQQSRR